VLNNLFLIDSGSQRFIPSEFGSDPTKAQVSELDDLYNFYAPKVEIRRLVEAEGIPYTVISCNFFMKILLPSLAQPGLDAPPRDKVTVYGDGNTKGIYMLHKSKPLLLFYLLLECSLSNHLFQSLEMCSVVILFKTKEILQTRKFRDLFEILIVAGSNVILTYT